MPSFPVSWEGGVFYGMKEGGSFFFPWRLYGKCRLCRQKERGGGCAGRILYHRNEGKTCSMAIAEESTPLQLSIADTSRFREGRITVRFRNEGNEPVRIPDEINDETADYFFVTVLRTERGDVRVLNRKVGKITFHRSLNYRELAPGQEYSVTIPVCLDEVDLEGWKQCSCELETRYYNQQGKDCFLGVLRATARLTLQ